MTNHTTPADAGDSNSTPTTTDSELPLLDQLADYISTNSFGNKNSFQIQTGDTLTADVSAMTPEGQVLARDALEAWSVVSGIHFEIVESAEANIRFSHQYDIGTIPNTAVARVDARGLTIYSAQVIVPEDSLSSNGAIRVFVHEIGHAIGLHHPAPYTKLYGLIFEDEAIFANDSWQATVMSYFSQSDNPSINQIATVAIPHTPQIADIIAIQLLYGKPAGANTGDTTYGVGANTDSYLDDVFAKWTGPDKKTGITVTIYDTDGFDTLDFSTDDTNQRINLNPEGISDVFTTGSLGTLIIARDTIIERYVAGSGDDSVTGNVADNLLEGRDGADTLMGSLGDDTLIGGTGADTLDGGEGSDTAAYTGSDAAVTVNLLNGTATGGDAEGDTFTSIENLSGSAHDDSLTGDASDNVLEGAAGADVLDGGDGLDTAAYTHSNAAVTVNLLNGTNTGGHAAGDTITNIENVSGSRYNDRLTGDTKANRLDGGSGHDRLMGGAGADVLVGGPGNDAAYYASSAAAVTVNLLDGTGTGGDAEGDTLDSIENLSGSAHDDTLTGNARNNVLSGRAGADLFDGSAGADTVSYSGSNAGVTVNLLTGAGERGDAEGDMLSNIENLIGSRYNDVLTGDTGNNVLRGGAGDDVIMGGAGADRLQGGTGQDTVSYAGSTEAVTVRLHSLAAKGGDAEGDTFPYTVDVAYTDADGVAQTDSLPDVENLIGSNHNDILAGDRRDNVIDGGAGNDTLYGGPGGGDDEMSGGPGNDRLFGGQGDDTLVGGPGADRFYGGHGQDLVSYTGSPEGVTVRLHTLAAAGGDAQGDTFKSLVDVAYTDANGVAQTDSLPDIEHLTGSNHNDILAGDRRDNDIDGGAGNDTLYGGPGGGDDMMSGGLGNDRLFGGQGDDTLIGGPGDDRLAGGHGNDVFVFGPGDGADTVTDFSRGTDKVDLTAFGIESVEDLDMDTTDDGVTIDLSDRMGAVMAAASCWPTSRHCRRRGILWFRNHIVNFALEANDFLAVRQDQGRQAGDKADWARVGKGSGRKIAWTAILMADFAKSRV